MRGLKIMMIGLWSLVGLMILAVLIFELFFGGLPFSGLREPAIFSPADPDSLTLVVDKSFPLAGLDGITLDLASDDCVVYVTDEDSVSVKHYVKNLPEDRYARAGAQGGELSITTGGNVFTFGIFPLVRRQSLLELYIPQAYAEDFSLSLGSGNVRVDGELSLSGLTLDIASGDVSAGGLLKARNAEIDVTSGNVRLTGGLEAEEYSIELSSGDLSVDKKLTGSGRVELTSGNVKLFGVEIADELGVDVASGDINLELAGEYGLDFSAEKTSGDIHAFFEMDRGDWDTYSATVGDAPYKKLSVDVTSGNINIDRK